ncbi:MAG: glycosyltransferase family 39 protein [Acidimicrobiia bacterium]|nr:glycosyltransferase family 39 protein [Acidimicrobiia bacterium]
MSLVRRRTRSRAELGRIGIAIAIACALAIVYQRSPALIALIVPTGMAGMLLFVGLRFVIYRPADTDDETIRWLRHVTSVMFVVHLLIALVINSSGQLVETFGGDAVTYHLGASEIVNHWNSGSGVGDGFVQTGKEGFFYALGALYWLFGTYQTAGLAVNAALAAAAVPLVYDTTRRLFGHEAARVAAVMVMILPGFLVWTSQLLREAPVVFFLALAGNATIRLTERASLGPCAVLAGSIAVLFTLRANVALVAAGGLLLGLVVGGTRVLASTTAGMTVVTLIIVLVLALGIGYEGYRLTSGADLQAISDIRQALAQTANTGLLPETDISTGPKAARFLPLALVNFALGPFPWQARNLRQLGGVVDALTLWFLLPSLWRGWARAGRVVGRRRIALVAPALFVAVGLSLLLGNSGTVVRERLQVTIFLLPLAAYGWTQRKQPATEPRPPAAAAALSRRW